MCQTVHQTIMIQVKVEVERQASNFSDPRMKAGSAIALGRLQRRNVRARRIRITSENSNSLLSAQRVSEEAWAGAGRTPGGTCEQNPLFYLTAVLGV